jgi:hypothetical protein
LPPKLSRFTSSEPGALARDDTVASPDALSAPGVVTDLIPFVTSVLLADAADGERAGGDGDFDTDSVAVVVTSLASPDDLVECAGELGGGGRSW